MNKRKKKGYNIKFDNLSEDSIASDTEMTGLVQTPPNNETESRSYTELGSIPKPIKIKRKK